MTLMMTSAQVVETSINVTNNSPSRDYSHPDDQTPQTTMSLVPKQDEVQELLLRLNVQVECIVESWLKHHINDSVVNIDGYNIVRKDRSSHEHGGVCIYIQDHIKFEISENLQCCNDQRNLYTCFISCRVNLPLHTFTNSVKFVNLLYADLRRFTQL